MTKKIQLIASAVFLLFIVNNCSKDDAHPEYPISINGSKIEFTITSCNGCGMNPGHQVIYEYGTPEQVQGFNTQDNNTINVDFYSYSLASDKRTASVRLNYHNGVSTEDYNLSSSDDNWMEGEYEYIGQTPSAYATAKGTYRVICTDCASFNGGGTGEEEIVSNPGQGVTFDGYTYESIVLGNDQEWMTENLRTTVYANGEPIPNVTDDTQWENLTTGAWVHYNNDSQYENSYGKLYNWYTVNDSRNICPTGWHVPTDSEWAELVDYLGGVAVAGGKIKSAGTQYWQSPNQSATNEIGFSGLPGGGRYLDGSYSTIGSYGFFWSSTEYIPTHSWMRQLSYDSGDMPRANLSKGAGICVRCIKD